MVVRSWRRVLRRPVPWGALAASLVVGTVLTVVNQGDLLFAGHSTLAFAWIIPLNYLVSLFLVTNSGYLD